jgi:hypothetical protein
MNTQYEFESMLRRVIQSFPKQQQIALFITRFDGRLKFLASSFRTSCAMLLGGYSEQQFGDVLLSIEI